MSFRSGRFVSIEGVEGVGKSTNIAAVERVLRRHDIPFVSTREPGGTPLSEKIRGLLLDREETQMTAMTELLLVFAARAQHVDQLIKPALARGEWVICDRFTDSSFAYQGGGRGINASVIEGLERDVIGGFEPDLTILLDLPVDIGMERASRRSERDRFELEELDFFRRVREAFLARASHRDRFRIVDASANIDVVDADVAALIEAEIRVWRQGN